MTAPRATPTAAQKGCIWYLLGVAVFFTVGIWAIVLSVTTHSPAPTMLVVGAVFAGAWLERGRVR